MSGFYDKVKFLDKYTGIADTFICMVILILVVLGCFWYESLGARKSVEIEEEVEEEPEPIRNFTFAQLSFFNGKKDPSDPEEDKAIYLSVHGRVFNVNKGRDFYGPGSPYENFAGHECGVAFAKFSFDTEFVDDLDGCETLSWFEKEELYNWLEKFSYYRAYPELGRLVPNASSTDRIVTTEELAQNNGSGEIPKGHSAAPIYVALKDKVFDVSFGGMTMYGAGGPYHRFAGKDVSRALAKMSFAPEDLDNTDISDLTEKEVKVLDDWCKTFEEKKLYPIVGKLQK